MIELRGLLESQGCGAHIIAKIEKPRAVKNIDEILDVVNAVMVARGDLGVEMDFPYVPIAQKSIAEKCQSRGIPCIIATEMLESMIHSPRPTRAEARTLPTPCTMRPTPSCCSAETSIGDFPVEAVQAMSRTLLAIEGHLGQATNAQASPSAVHAPRRRWPGRPARS